ncbi:MAG: hypothetical protein Q7T78_16940 [Rhodoferax sp.]|nr:hypothetical protein [Rhodoferax sp.]
MSWLYRVLAIGGLLAALWLGSGAWATHQQGIGEARATARYNAAIDQQKLDAGAALARETGRARQAEQALQAFKNQQEIRDAKNKLVVGALADQLRAAAGPAARLRDPNAPGCGVGGGSATGADPANTGGGAADITQAGGLFSTGATELFQRLTREADDINVAYASCRLDAFNLRKVLK